MAVQDGSGQLFVWGAQLEAGAFPTSYIPTSGSTATRAADFATIPTIDFGYNQSEGPVMAEWSGAQGSNYVNIFGDGGSSIMSLFYNSALGRVFLGDNPFATVDIAQNANKAAGSFDANSVDLSVNGSSISSAGGQDHLANWATAKIGGAWGNQNGHIHIKSIKYYPRRLSNAQLEELTQ